MSRLCAGVRQSQPHLIFEHNSTREVAPTSQKYEFPRHHYNRPATCRSAPALSELHMWRFDYRNGSARRSTFPPERIIPIRGLRAGAPGIQILAGVFGFKNGASAIADDGSVITFSLSQINAMALT